MQVSCSWRSADGREADVSAALLLRDDAAQHSDTPPLDTRLALEPGAAGGPCELTGALFAADAALCLAHAAWRPPVVLPRTMALRRVVVSSSARTLELLTAAPGAAFQYVASERGAPDDDDSCFIVDYEAEPDCVCGACPTLARARCTQAAA
jgi:hypothetical protein